LDFVCMRTFSGRTWQQHPTNALRSALMYRIIGANNREYGPVDADQMRRWIAEGRVNANTQVLAEGTTDWKPLSQFPELAAWLMSPPVGNAQNVAEKVNGPATGLIVVAILGFVAQIVGIAFNTLGVAFTPQQQGAPPWMNVFTGTIGLVAGIFSIGIGVVILFGALKMKRLESHNWAMASSILALVPCLSPCCLVGLPIGIWALVVLSDTNVKHAFSDYRP
jgi:hypothetical protein